MEGAGARLAARRSGGFDDQNLAVHPVELAPGGGRVECRAQRAASRSSPPRAEPPGGPVNRSPVIRPKPATARGPTRRPVLYSARRDFCYAEFVTNRQSGWNCGLNLVFDMFRDAAWQRGLAPTRRDAARAMKNATPKTLVAMVEPFRKRLKDEPCAEPPFDSSISEASLADMDAAVAILVSVLRRFVRGDGLGNWTWSEIADDLEKRVAYEQRGKPQAFKQATADLVRPFHNLLSQSSHHPLPRLRAAPPPAG